jgi:hypothetical protein
MLQCFMTTGGNSITSEYAFKKSGRRKSNASANKLEKLAKIRSTKDSGPHRCDRETIAQKAASTSKLRGIEGGARSLAGAMGENTEGKQAEVNRH